MTCPDVIVIGGGPLGATTATLVAQQGFRVTLLERERFIADVASLSTRV